MILKRGIPYADLTGRAVSPENLPDEWRSAEWVSVADYPWDESGYKPKVCASAAEHEGGITLLMLAREETISGTVTEVGGNVCIDSCMEFFFCPFADDERYINVEINCLGTAHIAIGTGRFDRRVWKALPEGVRVSASKHVGGRWAVSALIPASLLKECYGRTLTAGAVLRGNFYKCDETIHPHYGTWQPVIAAEPDFHRPECFGEMQVEP